MKYVILMSALLFSGIAIAEDHMKLAVQAYKEKNYPLTIQHLLKVVNPDAGNPSYLLYNLACVHALNGEPDKAVSWLNKIADQGVVYDLEKEARFDTVRENAGFKAVQVRFEKNLTPTDRSKVAFEIKEQNFLAEGLAFDPDSRRFFISSIRLGKIITIDNNGEQQEFSAAQDQLWSVLGLAIDAKRRNLWAATSALSEKAGFVPEDQGKSGLARYDLTTGKLIRKYVLNTPGKHVLGDVIVNSNGDAFTTDSLTPAVYRIRHDREEFEKLTDALRGPQGLCLSSDEKIIFVADVDGIHALDPDTGQIRALPAPPDTTLEGIDGLYRHGGNLIATQNGVKPCRILRLRMSSQMDRVEKVEILESGHPAFGEPTLGMLAGGFLYFVANNPTIGDLHENPEIQLKPSVILKLSME